MSRSRSQAKKFILIDHTIADISGHYYEYAVHVLHAARRAGYEPILATNRRFEPDAGDPWKVFPVYKYGFWSALGGGAKKNAPGGWRRRLWFQARCAFRFSLWGIGWRVRDRFGDFLLRQPVDRSSLKTVLLLTPLVLAAKIVRFLLLLAWLPVGLGWGLGKALGRALSGIARGLGGGAAGDYGNTLVEDVRGGVDFVRYLWRQRQGAREWFRQFRCIRRFASDTQDLLSKVELGEEDVLFVPTVSAVELMGLDILFRRREIPAGVSWHLLFRRDIYRGRRGDYAGQEANLGGLRQTFLSFGRRLAARRVFFHTDTDELTNQYNRLGGVQFSTVPIPHTHRPAERPAGGGPLNVIYVGDARFEKGYHLIPGVVQALWKDYGETGRVRFTLQSNYNIPQGEPNAVVARSQLESMPDGGVVKLHTRPLSSMEYEALLLSGDINLLFYDRNNYFARSSGILVESLGAGMPPIVPAGCWLSRQFLAETHRHLESWRTRLRPVRTVGMREMRWRVKGSPEANPKPAAGKGANELTAGGAPVMTWLRVPGRATHLLVEIQYRGASEDIQVGVEELDGDQRVVARHPERVLEADAQHRSLVLIPLGQGTASIALSLASPAAGQQVSVGGVRVDYFACGEDIGGRPPLGTIGLCYHDPREIETLLRDLIEHYEHYRATARAFAPSWMEYHNADRLVRELRAVAGHAVPELAGVAEDTALAAHAQG